MAYRPTREFQSKYREFMFGEFRRFRSKIYVTVDTVVPVMPKETHKEPDDIAYHNKQQEMDDQID